MLDFVAVQYNLDAPSFTYNPLGWSVANDEVVPRVGREGCRSTLMEQWGRRQAGHGKKERREGGRVLYGEVFACAVVNRQKNVEGKC